MKLHALSEAGENGTNEDVYVVEPHPEDERAMLCCLADGQGGRFGGGRASALACRTALELASSRGLTSLRFPSTWQYLLSEVDQGVAREDRAGLTTLIGSLVADNHIVGAASGDSALWVVTGEHLHELTKHQKKNPPVGSGDAVFTPFEMRLEPPWQVVAMSDGVWKYVSAERLRDALLARTGEDLLASLADSARLRVSRTFPDDFTAVVLHEPG